MASDEGEQTPAAEAMAAETMEEAEMRAINERLLIASVREQEHAQRAEEAERRAAEALGQMRAAHDGLHATHAHLQSTLAEVRAAYERERRITQALQRPLTLEVPEDAFPGLSVATLYSSAWDEAEVGGDFYDAFTLPDGRVALCVGDASGKGLAAAARATEVKDVLRAYLRLYPFYPALALTRLSDYLCDSQSLDERADDTFVALSLAVVDRVRGEAVFSWAGIDPPILARAGGEVERVSGAGLPLGIGQGQHYADTTVGFGSGDMVLLSTDGLSEARRGMDFLGTEGVDALVGRSRTAPTLRAMGEAVLGGARAFAGGQLQDDACLVLARRL